MPSVTSRFEVVSSGGNMAKKGTEAAENSEFILGMDIGYSNFKLAFGHRESDMTTLVRPVGAAPLSLMPQKIGGGHGSDFVQVLVNNEQWAACVEPGRIQGWERELHADYPSTNQYKALFYAALALTEQPVIDVLVTGLPVDQFKDENTRKRLKDKLTGNHQIANQTTIEVKKVVVVPQPAGAYMDISESVQEDEIEAVINQGRTVVIDPGFFSVDWVSIAAGEMRYNSSGTSLKAMSVLLDDAASRIKEEFGGQLSVEKLESAIVSGKNEIPLYGKMVPIKSYVEEAIKKIPDLALTSMKKSMREEGLDADVILLAGGGATFYKEAAKRIFPKAHIIMSANPELANARGFWMLG